MGRIAEWEKCDLRGVKGSAFARLEQEKKVENFAKNDLFACYFGVFSSVLDELRCV
jgi:hypothetical protein